MSFNKNQKSYNKQVMQTGKEANKYLSNALGLINQYTTDYAGRNEFWLDKLNDRQLDLLSDKYLAQNAAMMRGQSAFGSTSDVARQQENNAYTQQNYLANVANQNVMNANQLQSNELNALMNASTTYQTPIQYGAQAAANVDAANNSIFGTIGKGLQAVGTVASFIPGGQVIGPAVSGIGGALSGMANTTSLDYTEPQRNYFQSMFGQAGAAYQDYGSLIPGSKNLSTQGSTSNSTLSTNRRNQ